MNQLEIKRRKSRLIHVGNVPIGGDSEITVQSMTNTLTTDIKKTVEQIKETLKLDSLYFLSIKGLYNAMGFKDRNKITPQFTDHCFTGDYPTGLTDQQDDGHVKQLSLLAEQV